MLEQLKLGTKISLGFAISAGLLLLVGGVGLGGSARLDDHIGVIGSQQLPIVEHLLRLSLSHKMAWLAERGLINRRMMDAEIRQAQYDYLQQALLQADEHWKAYEAFPRSAAQEALWRKFVPVWESWRTGLDRTVELSRQKDQLATQGVPPDDPRLVELDGQAYAQSLENRKQGLVVNSSVEELVQLNLERSKAEVEAAGVAADAVQLVIGLTLGLGVLLALLLGLFFTRSIRRIVGDLLGETARLSEAAIRGALSSRGEPETVNHEFRGIIEGFNQTLEAVIAPLKVAADYLQRISHGDIPAKITDRYEGDFNEIKNNLNTCIDAVDLLVSDANRLAAAAIAGQFDTRADVSRHQGDFAKVVRGVNSTLDVVVDRCFWYEQLLDAIPFPLSVTDLEMNWTFINKPVEQLLGVRRRDVVGKACNNWNANICRTKDCGIARLRQNQLRTRFDQQGHNFQVDTSYIANARGERIGHIEVVQDISAVAKVAEFSRREVERVAGNLQRLAGGDLELDLTLTDADEFTAGAHADFLRISGSLETVKVAVGMLVADTGMLCRAAIEGKLQTRAAIDRHQGDFRKIVQGVNDTLDAVLRPIQEASQVLDSLAGYDLRARMSGDYQGDHDRIKQSLNATAEALHDALAQVADSTDQLASASNQIASSSQSVAEGASEQASALEETSSTLEQMAGMTNQNADNTQAARALSRSTKETADKGGAAMQRMVESMGKIRRAAEGTAEIIKDINEIAFQTNLLALNAAVEAARAGDAGRGFAVVAEEVRNLALRSKEAAKRTEELIKESVSLAGDGETISNLVNGNLSEILDSVSKVNGIIGEIAVASQEQARGIEQVNKAVVQMNSVVQQSAANSEESSSAAEELASHAQELAAMVGRFRLGRSVAARGPASLGASARPALPSALLAGRMPPRSGPAPAPGNGHGNGRKPSNGSYGLRPEELIPLDDDPLIREF